jgi:hypothetical protein
MRKILTAIVFAATSAAQADFTPMEAVTPAYTSSTTLLDIGSIPIGTSVTSVTDGYQTASFSETLTRADVPAQWATWGHAPHVESPTPPVLYRSPENSLAITLAVPSYAFGLELLGVAWSVSEFQVTFLDVHGIFVGTVNGYLDGFHGARVFAASTTNNPFSTVLISVLSDDSDGLAIAQIRYSVVPEPTSYLMIVQAVAMVAVVRWKRMKRGVR